MPISRLQYATLIAQAKEKKIALRDVQEWTDGVVATAENYGPTWQAEFGANESGSPQQDEQAWQRERLKWGNHEIETSANQIYCDAL